MWTVWNMYIIFFFISYFSVQEMHEYQTGQHSYEWINVSCHSIWFSISIIAAAPNSFLVNHAAFWRIMSFISNVTSVSTNSSVFAEATNPNRRYYLEVVMGGTSGVEI